MGVDAETAAKGIETFKGTHRRFEKKGFLNGAVAVSYTHLYSQKSMTHTKYTVV